jgi:hypothetical protein
MQNDINLPQILKIKKISEYHLLNNLWKSLKFVAKNID